MLTRRVLDDEKPGAPASSTPPPILMRRSTRVTSPCWREAGKTLTDATGELREAVDFLRYSFAQAQQTDRPARKRIACIRQWNFPLAISTGQIAGALANGDFEPAVAFCPRADPAADHRRDRARRCPAGTACLCRYHRIGGQRRAFGRGRRLT